MCCGSSLTGDLPSAVWPAGLVPHVFVCCDSSLTGDLPSAVWPAGLVPHEFVCCGSSLTGDLPSASYEEILDISLFYTIILTFSCCSLSMANTGDEVIYLHYFDFVNFYKNSVGEILIVHAICFIMIPIQL